MITRKNRTELSESNFRRISWINILLTPPLLLVFAWPFYFILNQLPLPATLVYVATFCFAFPFTLTILHGHVTIAIGAPHRLHYYQWLLKHSFSYGLLIRPLFFSTRFRLILLVLGVGILIIGFVL